LVFDVAAQFSEPGETEGAMLPVIFPVAVTTAPDGNIFIRRNDRIA
jgi:hypothetical protein